MLRRTSQPPPDDAPDAHDDPTPAPADVLGVPAGTVKSRLSRAKGALRAALDADARAGELAMESTR